MKRASPARREELINGLEWQVWDLSSEILTVVTSISIIYFENYCT